LCEHDAAAGLQLLHALPGVIDVGGGIVAAYSVLAECLGEPRDLVPVELEAGADHEIIVGHGVTVVEAHGVLIRFEALRGGANPANTNRKRAPLVRAGARWVVRARADKSEGGLIVGVGGRLDDGTARTGRPPLQDRRGGDSGSAAADDENLVMCRARHGYT